jgi:hypothetical protein
MPFNGQYDPDLNNAGLYTYTVTAEAPCPNDAGVLAVIEDPCTGIDESVSGALGLRWIGTDAAGASLFGITAARPVDWQALDTRGRIYAAGRSIEAQGTLCIPTSAWPPGVYVLRIMNDGRGTAVRFTR